MKKKESIVVAILLLAVGFAAISTTLIINGTLTVTLNKTATEEVREEYVCTLTFNAVERDTLGVTKPVFVA